jgi:hypothetical protein
MTPEGVLLCTIDDTPQSAALLAALVTRVVDARFDRPRPTIAIALAGPRAPILKRLAKACARRGLAVELEGEAIVVAGHTLALAPEGTIEPTHVRLREHRVELERAGAPRLGERAELLAAAPLLEAIERGAGLRWALLSLIEGDDGFAGNVELCERRPDAGLDAALQRCFPGLVGRVGFSSAVGPLPGAALHLTVLLGAGTTVDGVRDLLAAQAHESRSRWPSLRARSGFGSADCLGDPDVHLDLDAITSAGPLLRLVAYYDPPSVLAGDLLRRLTERR